jgi:hypothetical protein
MMRRKATKNVDLIETVKPQPKLRHLDISNCKINEISLDKLLPNVVDNVLVNINDGKRTVVLNPEMGGVSYKNWLKNKGGIFAKDVRNFTLDKFTGKYVIYESGSEKLVLRMIDDNEILDFEAKRLVSGNLKDTPYMLFKVIENNELTSYKLNKTMPILEEELEVIIDDTDKTTDLDDTNYVNNISLFEN